jgi:hypothetical protein
MIFVLCVAVPMGVGCTTPASAHPQGEIPQPAIRAAVQQALGDSELIDFVVSPSRRFAVARAPAPGAQPTFVPALFRIDLKARTAIRMTDYGTWDNLSWSPDDVHVAYSSDGGAGQGIDWTDPTPMSWYVQNVLTLQRKCLFREPPTDRRILYQPIPELEWIPDGHSVLIVALKPRGLYHVDIGSGRRVRLTRDPPGLDLVRKRAAIWWLGPGRFKVATLPANLDGATSRLFWRRLRPRGPFRFPGATGLLDVSAGARKALVRIDTGFDGRHCVLAELDTIRGLVRVFGESRSSFFSILHWPPVGSFVSIRYEPDPRTARPGRPAYARIRLDDLPFVPPAKVDWRHVMPIRLLPVP